MLNSTQDLFWLVISFVVLWIGIVIGWGGFYIAMILRDVQKISGSFRRKMDTIDEILETVKKRVESTANYLPPIIEGAGKLMEHFKEKKAKKKK